MLGISKFIAGGAGGTLAGLWQHEWDPREDNSLLCVPSVILAGCTALLFLPRLPLPPRGRLFVRPWHGGAFWGWPLSGSAASAALLGNHGLSAACGGWSGSAPALRGERMVSNQQLLVKVEVK